MSSFAAKVGLTFPHVGTFIWGVGNAFLSEGEWDLGSEFTIKGMTFTHLGALAHKGSLCHDVVKTSLIRSTVGIAVRGLWNCYSGIRNQDLSRIGKGALQCAASSASYQLISNLPPSVLSVVSATAVSCYWLHNGIRGVAEGEITVGTTITALSLAFMIHSGFAAFR